MREQATSSCFRLLRLLILCCLANSVCTPKCRKPCGMNRRQVWADVIDTDVRPSRPERRKFPYTTLRMQICCRIKAGLHSRCLAPLMTSTSGPIREALQVTSRDFAHLVFIIVFGELLLVGLANSQAIPSVPNVCPPPPPYKYLRADEDYQYLSNPNCRTDTLDVLK